MSVKPQHFAILTGILLVAALALLLPGAPRSGNARPNPQAVRTLTVTGEGEIRVKPDLVQVTFGVMTTGASATEAEALNVASAKQVQAALLQAGAEEGETEISQVAVSTNTFQDFAGAIRIGSFQGRSTVRGTFGSVARVQQVIDAGLNAGATSLEGVAYLLESPETSKQAAMKAALENARLRATALVKAEGEGLGEMTALEVLLEEAPPLSGTSPGSLVFRARVKATFQY